MDGFNDACKKIAASYLKVGDESMSDSHFQTTAKGDSHQLSHILRMSEPMDTEFNTEAFYFTWGLIFLETKILKEGMKRTKYH